MDPLTIISMASASIAFLKEAIPTIQDAFSRGEITKEQQDALRAEYESLKARADGQFRGPEWEQSGRVEEEE